MCNDLFFLAALNLVRRASEFEMTDDFEVLSTRDVPCYIKALIRLLPSLIAEQQ